MTIQLPQALREHLKEDDIQELTPIQERAFEPIKAGKNVLGVSPTGTGKTLAYL
ncbi:DEAD/DEAH box helicase, partial [Streptococcus sobrinus]